MPATSLRTALALLALCAVPGLAHSQARSPAEDARAARDPETVLSAIVHVRMKALEGARSSANLGTEREGTGVVIDERGHIVTIGYVVVEADTIEVTTQGKLTVPAVLAGYDHATGLGLLRASAPLPGVQPLEMGSADALPQREPVMVLPHGGRASASIGYVMSQRKFTASWEYLLERALFVSPPSTHWAGAALVNREGKLVGIGSLLVRAVAPDQAVPGNMFVPVDLLKPILADLIATGRRAGPARPWLGLGTDELQGHLLVTSVTPEGPAALAGIQRGDIVVAVGAQAVRSQEELYRRIWSTGAAGVEIPLKVLHDAELREVRVRSIDRAQHFREKRAP